MRAPRGAAVPETAVILGVVLTLLFGTFELGLIGLAQLGGDGAAFVAAHASALGNDPNAAIAGPFPTVAQNGTVAVQSNAPASSNVAVDFQVQNQNARHGGVQIVRPSQTQATVTQTGIGIGNILPETGLTSAAVEANMMVSGHGFDLDGAPMNSATTYANQLGYFADDGNAPPYFIGFKYLYHCTPLRGQGCQQNAQMYAGGFAEYLDGSNWSQPQNGIGPGGVYAAMSIHQSVYATIGAKLQAMGSVAGGNADGSVLDPKTSSCIQTVNNWDIPVPAGYPIGSVGIGKYPLNPLGNVPGCS